MDNEVLTAAGPQGVNWEAVCTYKALTVTFLSGSLPHYVSCSCLLPWETGCTSPSPPPGWVSLSWESSPPLPGHQHCSDQQMMGMNVVDWPHPAVVCGRDMVPTHLPSKRHLGFCGEGLNHSIHKVESGSHITSSLQGPV